MKKREIERDKYRREEGCERARGMAIQRGLKGMSYRKKLFRRFSWKRNGDPFRRNAFSGDEKISSRRFELPLSLSRKLSRKRPLSRAHRALAAPRMHVQLGRVPRGVWSEWHGRESRSRNGELASTRRFPLADGWKLRMIAGVARA